MSAKPFAANSILENASKSSFVDHLAAEIGLLEAIFFQRLHYWLKKSKHIIDDVPWVYNTYDDWGEQMPFASPRQLRKSMRKLENLGLVRSERMESHHWNQRKWYTICYDKLADYDFDPTVSVKRTARKRNSDKTYLDGSITRSTTRSTTTNTDGQTESVKNTNSECSVSEFDEEKKNYELPKFRNLSEAETSNELNSAEQVEEIPEQSQNSKSTPKFSEKRKIDPKLEKDIIDGIFPCPFNAQLKRLVASAKLESVMTALTVLKENQACRVVINPAGLFRRALIEGWKPNSKGSMVPEEFDEWFKLARDADLVMSSEKKDGQLWIFDANAQPFPYEEMLQRYPLESLRASPPQEERRSPFVPSAPPKAVTEPFDFSDILSAIDIQIARLGWGKDKVQQFLKTTYGKISRSLLRDEELMDFKLKLQNL